MGILQWGRIAKRLSQLASDSVLRREVDLLEQLWRDGQAAGRSESAKRKIRIGVFVQMLMVEACCPHRQFSSRSKSNGVRE